MLAYFRCSGGRVARILGCAAETGPKFAEDTAES
jgi:hypothetical protein